MLKALRQIVVASMACLAGVTVSVAAEKFRFGHVYEIDTAHHLAAVAAAAEIKRRTNGRYEIEVYPAGSLGREQDLFQSLRLGSVDLTYTGSFYAGTNHGPMSLSSAPFLFRDFEHWKSYAKSDVFREIAAEFEKKSSLHVLGLVYYGARHLTSNKPVRTPDDMKGMKLRVPSTAMYVLFPKAMGANATPIDFAEVYLALQNGTVDGQENPLPTIFAKKFYEVQKFISLTGHIQDSLVTLASPSLWKKLSPEDRAIFADVYRESAAAVSEEVVRSEERLAKEFETKYGITVLRIDREPFRTKMLPLTTAAAMPWTKEMVERVQALK